MKEYLTLSSASKQNYCQKNCQEINSESDFTIRPCLVDSTKKTKILAFTITGSTP